MQPPTQLLAALALLRCKGHLSPANHRRSSAKAKRRIEQSNTATPGETQRSIEGSKIATTKVSCSSSHAVISRLRRNASQHQACKQVRRSSTPPSRMQGSATQQTKTTRCIVKASQTSAASLHSPRLGLPVPNLLATSNDTE